MSKTPYTDAPPWRLWRRAVAAPAPEDVDPVVAFPFRVSPQDRVVTAGSCFAQHIARHLRTRGFNVLTTEAAHPVLDEATAAQFNYGIYSARYGNIYSARQLLQLFQRAHGAFVPREPAWHEGGAWFDPFRPTIQPGGFASAREFDTDRAQHFAAVRRAFAELDVFVFTLGLTEIWESTEDGAVFPLCPGTAHGVFDAAKYRLRNLSVEENAADLTQFAAALRRINPASRIILTVSPVPLVATAENQHVLAATTYSKSVLRVAAEIASRTPGIGYFPSYEIITGSHAQNYFEADRRSVSEAGVAHVMRCFFRNVAAADSEAPAPQAPQDAFAASKALMEILCDEERLDPANSER